MSKINRRTLATFSSFPEEVRDVLHDVLLGYPDAVQDLVSNPDLRSDVCRRLYAKKAPDVRTARSLVHRALPPDAREIVVQREKRSNVLEAFFADNIPSAEEQEVLVAKSSLAGARLMLDRFWLRPDLRRQLALRCKGVELLREMAYGVDGGFSSDEILTQLAAWETWGLHKRQYHTRMMLTSIFSRYPEVIEPATAIDYRFRHHTVLNAMAASTALNSSHVEAILSLREKESSGLQFTRNVYAPLLENPRTPLDVVERILGMLDQTERMMIASSIRKRGSAPAIDGDLATVSEPMALTRLLDACAPENRTIVSPAALLELTVNPSVSPRLFEQIQKSWSSLRGFTRVFAWTHEQELLDRGIDAGWRNGNSTWRYQNYEPDADVQRLLLEAAGQLGSDRSKWETLVSLINEFDGDFESLVEVASAL